MDVVRSGSWWVTKIEADATGKPLRVYHRNGGPWGRDVTKAWTHALGAACDLCQPETRREEVADK